MSHIHLLVCRALALRERGESIEAVAAACGLPHGTVARWCRGLVPADAAIVLAGGIALDRCDACGCPAHDRVPARRYAYLLGVYLGDGCLARSGRTIALRIAMDAAYPGVIAEVTEAILAVRGGGRVSRYHPPDERCVSLTSYTRAWLCLFPAWSRSQARAADRARAMAAGDRRRARGRLRAG